MALLKAPETHLLRPAILHVQKAFPFLFPEPKPLPFTGATFPRATSFLRARITLRCPKPIQPVLKHKSPTSISSLDSCARALVAAADLARADSNREIAATFAVSVSIAKLLVREIELFLSKIVTITPNPSFEEFVKIQSFKQYLASSAGPLFFAAVNRKSESITKWLDVYGGILMFRALLSWDATVPWDRQPLSAIRDLCDPYLNLFGKIMPPVSNSLDMSQFFDFVFLGVFTTILNSDNFESCC